jgi:streptomycin 6-kinase
MNPLARLKALANKWHVTVEKPWDTPSAIVAYGTRGADRFVIKISKRRGDEWQSGNVLRAFAGQGMVRVYEFEPGAVLLERLDPANPLVELVRQGDDESATEILAELISRMSGHAPSLSCVSVMDWGLGFDRYLSSGDKQIDYDLVIEARERFLDLAKSQNTMMLLHGDLHHYNVLFDKSRGWTAIDPKGVVGEVEYEVGAIVRNPIERPELFTSAVVIERRLHLFADRLGLDYHRMLAWSFAQAVLSAIWNVEDGYAIKRDHHSLILAHTIKSIGTP